MTRRPPERSSCSTRRTSSTPRPSNRRPRTFERSLGSGGSMVGFTVRDKFTDYGMVGVVVLRCCAAGIRVDQMVMSCRVFGLDAELAVLVEVMKRAQEAGEHRVCWGLFRNCQLTSPAGTMFQRLGFVEVSDGVWSVDGEFNPTQNFSVSVEWREQTDLPVDPAGWTLLLHRSRSGSSHFEATTAPMIRL